MQGKVLSSGSRFTGKYANDLCFAKRRGKNIAGFYADIIFVARQRRFRAVCEKTFSISVDTSGRRAFTSLNKFECDVK